MSKIIEFPQEEKYLDEMTRPELEEYLCQLKLRLAALDGREPKNMTSAAYEAWAEEHEALEDAIDEILDLLED